MQLMKKKKHNLYLHPYYTSFKWIKIWKPFLTWNSFKMCWWGMTIWKFKWVVAINFVNIMKTCMWVVNVGFYCELKTKKKVKAISLDEEHLIFLPGNNFEKLSRSSNSKENIIYVNVSYSTEIKFIYYNFCFN